MDRREIVEIFRRNLSELIVRSGVSQSAYAARAKIDRSTLSQLLSPENARLPRAETIAALAGVEQVSIDWLLGLSQKGQVGADVLGRDPFVESGGESSLDECLQRWHAEAAGYKIRYIPSSLPDLLKTKAVIDFEYGEQGERLPAILRQEAEARLAYSRRPETDMEACSSIQSLESFARGENIWRTLAVEERRAQLESMMQLIEELYPTFRWFLFDGLQYFSIPFTIFGPQRVAIYAGGMYIVFNTTEQIRIMTRQFDSLIRAAIVQPPDVAKKLDDLLRETKSHPKGGGERL